MTIAVTTPAGHVGSHVVRMLCQAGVRPRLLVRNPDRLGAEMRDQVDLAVGDQRDAEYVATRGVAAIFWVHPDDWSLPDADADAARDEAGAALLHLRCGYFMTNLLTELDGLRAGRLTTIRPLDDPMPWVDPQNIATVATVRLLAGDWTGRQVQAVHGPADLTWTEAAAALSTATGVPIEAQQITADEQRAALRDAGISEGCRGGDRRHGHRQARRVHPGTAARGADHDAEQPGRLGDHPPAPGAVTAPGAFRASLTSLPRVRPPAGTRPPSRPGACRLASNSMLIAEISACTASTCSPCCRNLRAKVCGVAVAHRHFLSRIGASDPSSTRSSSPMPRGPGRSSWPLDPRS